MMCLCIGSQRVGDFFSQAPVVVKLVNGLEAKFRFFRLQTAEHSKVVLC